MQRNLDLIRKILLRVESSNKTVFVEADFADLCSDPLELRYNLYLTVDAGLVDAFDVTSCGSWTTVPEYEIKYLTNWGCDYLDSVRSPSVWRKTKDLLKAAGGGASLEIVSTIATKVFTHLLESQLPG